MAQEEKPSKSNGLGTDPLQRLASFKPPRDLSLGGVKPNKKVFTPNLLVTRNKNKSAAATNNRDQKKDDKGRKDRKNDRNKNFKNGPNIIKSSGVFSEGLGSAERQTSRGSYSSRDSDHSTTVLQKPTIRVKDVIKIDKELEEQKIRSVMGDSGGDDEEEMDFKKLHDKDAPIRLPMDDGSWSHHKPAVKVKQEVVVKTEPNDDLDISSLTVDEKPPIDVKEVFDNTDVVNLLRSDKSTLILLQLPDSLPGRGGSVDDDGPRRKTNTEPSTSNSDENDIKQADNRCRLNDLEEGKIGKLLVHRSGRVSLLLGDTVFEVCPATKSAFYQEAVSVAVDEQSRSANLVALGPLQHKLNIVPDWEAMFSNMPV